MKNRENNKNVTLILTHIHRAMLSHSTARNTVAATVSLNIAAQMRKQA